jgi:hypothetical protein
MAMEVHTLDLMPVINWLSGLILSSAVFGAELRVATTPIQPGATGPAVIYLLSQGRSVAGVQFDLEHDPSLTIMFLPGESAIRAAKELYLAELAPGKKRLLVVGMNREAMPDEAVAVLSIRMQARAAGAYELKLTNAVAVDPDGEPISVPGFVADIAVAESNRVR